MKLLAKSSKIFLPLLAFTIIIVLIFLPEILGIKKGSIETLEEKELPVVEEKLESEVDTAQNVQRQQEESGNAFEGLGVKIGRFLSDRTSNVSTRKNSEQKRKVSLAQVSKEKYPAEQISDWSGIAAPSIQAHLQSAIGRVDQLLTRTGVTYAKSRKELLGFKEILLSLTIKKESKDDPRAILEDLERKDLAVTTAMLNDLVPNELLRLWAGVNLNKFYEYNYAQNLKVMAASAFNPQLQIHDATFYITGDPAKGSHRLASLGLNFVLLNQGVKEIQLFKNKVFVKKLKMHKDRFAPEWSYFSLEVDSGKDLYSFHVYNKNKDLFVKYYRFAPNFSQLSLSRKEPVKKKRKSAKKQKPTYDMLYASAEDNALGRINLIDELYQLKSAPTSSKSSTPEVNMDQMVEF